MCVDWNAEQAFVQWLSKRSGQSYRLPSEAEWEYAARAGSRGLRHWGNGETEACRYANVADRTAKRIYRAWSIFDCDDGYVNTAPVRRYSANSFGLHDMLGNVWEWTEDCWNSSYQGAPSSGVAWTTGDCSRRVVRGGSWGHTPAIARSAGRFNADPMLRSIDQGFRVARTLP